MSTRGGDVQYFDNARAVGRRLRETRERAGLTQRQLSFPGCSAGYLSRIESGERTPSLQLMRELARRLGTSEGFLAQGVDEAIQADSLLEAELALRMDDQGRAEELFRADLDSDEQGRRAAALEGLGQLAFRRGVTREAIELLEQASEAFGEAALTRSALQETLGRAYNLVGDLEASISVLERSLRAAKEREDLLAEVRFSVLLSAALSDAGRISQAEEHVSNALVHADELADPLARVRVYWAQWRLHLLKNRLDLAERYGRKVIELLELTEDSYHLARAYELMANVELDRGDPSEALELLRKARSTLENPRSEPERATSQLIEARALAQMGELDAAAELAMSLADGLADRPEETGRSYHVLAGVFAARGDRARAIELYELACAFLEQTPNRFLVDAYAKLAEQLEAEGRKDEAYDVLRKAVQLQAGIASGA